MRRSDWPAKLLRGLRQTVNFPRQEKREQDEDEEAPRGGRPQASLRPENLIVVAC